VNLFEEGKTGTQLLMVSEGGHRRLEPGDARQFLASSRKSLDRIGAPEWKALKGAFLSNHLQPSHV